MRALNNKVYYEKLLAEEQEVRRKNNDTSQKEFTNQRNFDGYRSSEMFIAYEALCRGEDYIVSIQLNILQSLKVFQECL